MTRIQQKHRKKNFNSKGDETIQRSHISNTVYYLFGIWPKKTSTIWINLMKCLLWININYILKNIELCNKTWTPDMVADMGWSCWKQNQCSNSIPYILLSIWTYVDYDIWSFVIDCDCLGCCCCVCVCVFSHRNIFHKIIKMYTYITNVCKQCKRTWCMTCTVARSRLLTNEL